MNGSLIEATEWLGHFGRKTEKTFWTSEHYLEPAGGRRRSRLHSGEFKADAVAACTQPGVSMASVAMSCGINANLLRRWVKATEMRAEVVSSCEPKLLAPTAACEVNVELRRGATTISVTWPAVRTHAQARRLQRR